MRTIIRIPAIILATGIFISFLRLFAGTSGSGLGDFFDSIIITSFVLFLSTLIMLILRFKDIKSYFLVWLYIIISSPLTLSFLYGLGFDIFANTTTPRSFRNTFMVDKFKYSQDSASLVNLVDSLIEKRIVYKPAKLTLRSFDGKMYNDTIDRSWAIDLPLKNTTYLGSRIDTIFYSPNDSNLLAGLLINKRINEYIMNLNNPEGVEYYGSGFIAVKKNDNYYIEILRTSTSNGSLKSCSDYLYKLYCKEANTDREEYNLNDVRFWKENRQIDELKGKTGD